MHSMLFNDHEKCHEDTLVNMNVALQVFTPVTYTSYAYFKD